MINLENNTAVFDESSSNWSPYRDHNELFLRTQERYFNEVLRRRGHVFLNEILDSLDIPRTPAGQLVGWLYTAHKNHIAFDIKYAAPGIQIDFNVDGVIYEKI